jgi:HK97 family phage major capsid protein
MLDAELKAAIDALGAEHKTVVTDLKSRYDALQTEHKALQTQLDAIDVRIQGRVGATGVATKSLKDLLGENDQVSRLLHDKKGTAIITLTGSDAAAFLERKTTVTEAAAGFQTTGVLQLDRIPGITPEARQVLKVRDVLTARPTNLGYVDFVGVLTPMAKASPQTEANDKGENAVAFQSYAEKVRTIATWIPASRQILDDLQELANFINTSVRYYVDLEEELQLLSGDGTGENLNGLIPQATAFNTGLLSASKGWNKIDIIGEAIIQQAVAKELTPTFVVLNPVDWGGMRLTKDSLGRYLLGDPQANVPANLFNKAVVETTSIAAGTFLLGTGDPVGSEIRDRMETQIEISTQHADYFVKNLVAVRGEKRLALVVKRPKAFLTGSFSQSPA